MKNITAMRMACYSSPGRRKRLAAEPLQLPLPRRKVPGTAFFNDFLLGHPNIHPVTRGACVIPCLIPYSLSPAELHRALWHVASCISAKGDPGQ